jgi:beta-lactamase regulating signal transducer with metallopeptidase domain
MMVDLFFGLLSANLALAIAVAVVMAVRLPVRRLFGARVAYGLWSLPPLAVLGLLLPARVMKVTVPSLPAQARPAAGETFADAVAASAATFDMRPLLVALWLLGVLASVAWLVVQQVQFARATRAGKAGPAVVGVLRPRLVVPDDFTERYTPREREVVLAHELTHMERRDPPVNALLALLTCVCWFNPAVHVMGRWLRIDQELACDARVVAAYPKARKAYAEAMLKTQLAARPLPLGCHWSAHPLAQRVRLLSRPAPSRARRLAGVALTMVLGAGGALAVWTVRPPEVALVAEAPTVAAEKPKPLAPPPPRAPDAPTAPRLKAEASLPKTPVVVAEAAPAPADDEVRVLPAPDVIPAALPLFVRKPRIVHAVADRSLVPPGLAVRVVASGLAPDGAPLWSDFTAFGSQRIYRKGAYERGGSRYSLFTSVAQEGERLRVTVSLGREFHPQLTSSIDLPPGGTGVVKLPTGQDFVVTATQRPETPDEVEEGRHLTAYRELFEGLRPGRSDRPGRTS